MSLLFCLAPSALLAFLLRPIRPQLTTHHHASPPRLDARRPTAEHVLVAPALGPLALQLTVRIDVRLVLGTATPNGRCLGLDVGDLIGSGADLGVVALRLVLEALLPVGTGALELLNLEANAVCANRARGEEE